MRIIEEGHREYVSLLARQPNKDTSYRPSHFLLRQDTEDGTLLCNALTGELVILSDEEKRLFDGSFGSESEDMAELIRRHYLVPAVCCEDRTADDLRALFLKRKAAKQIIAGFNILPTTCCNARCFYCYESDIRRVSMDDETADRLVDFIVEHHGDKPVKLWWFGGEPMVNASSIDRICKKLKAAGIRYTSKMTSNGYLFDTETVMRAKHDWKLDRIQITLDGTREVYNRTKAYRCACEDPYQRVVENIALFANEEIRVDIRLNLDKHNADDLGTLIRELADRFGDRKQISVYLSRLDEGAGFEPISHTKDDLGRLQMRWIELNKLLEENGWHPYASSKLPSLRVVSCMADDPCTVQCTPDGILTKCESLIYDHAVGSLTEGVTDRNEELYWRERASYAGCETCPLYPSCTRLLKHCPVKTEKCTDHEKERRVDGYHRLMLAKYQNWKNGGGNSV